MDGTIGDNPHIYRSKVDASGRIVLPAEVRSRQKICAGDEVMLVERAEGLEVKTLQQAIREAQSAFARLAPPDVVLSETLIQERREEAARE